MTFKKSFFIFLLSFYVADVAASFRFSHPDCKIRIKRRSRVDSNLTDMFEAKLKERNFTIQFLIDDRKLFKDEMYALMEITKTRKKIYQDCAVRVIIKKAKSRFVRGDDKVLYEKEITRTFPRVTLNGSERCRYALKDVFVHIPKCEKR